MREDEIILLFKRNRYISYIFQYGMIPVIFLLEHYIQTENYEECVPIKDAVKDINTHASGKLDFVVDNMKDVFSLYGYGGERHMQYLMEDMYTIKEDIENIKV